MSNNKKKPDNFKTNIKKCYKKIMTIILILKKMKQITK